MGVYLSRSKTCMSKQLFDGIKIGAPIQKVGCITVPQNVWTAFFPWL